MLPAGGEAAFLKEPEHSVHAVNEAGPPEKLFYQGLTHWGFIRA